jgi:hypothetical protein
MENTHIADLETIIEAAVESETLSDEPEERLLELVEIVKDATPAQKAVVRTRFRQEYDRFFPAGNHTFESFFEHYFDPENPEDNLEADPEFAISVAKEGIECLSMYEDDTFDEELASSREEFVEQIQVQVCFAILVAINIVAIEATTGPALSIQPKTNAVAVSA